MSGSLYSKLAAISAVHLICALTGGLEGLRYNAAAATQDRVNPQAQVMAGFNDRVNAYLALQKKVERGLPAQKETADPERIKAHVASLADGIRAARADAKPGDVFGDAAEPFRTIIKQDSR